VVIFITIYNTKNTSIPEDCTKKDIIMTDRERLQKILLEKSYRQGEFTLTSGKVSDFYIDVKQTSLSAEGAYLCGKAIMEIIQQEQTPIDAVGGMTLGADPLVTAASIASFHAGNPIPAFIVRKKAKGHGTGNYIEGLKNMPAGCTVALLEDVVTTGGTLVDVIKRVEDAGFKVGVIITIVERQEGGTKTIADAGYELKSVFTRQELLSE
jgi:orotate phosphoribosyltransferase